MTIQLNRHQRRALGEAGLAIETRLIEADSLEQQLAAFRAASDALFDGVDALHEPVAALAKLINAKYVHDIELGTAAAQIVATLERNNICVLEALAAACLERPHLRDRAINLRATAKHYRGDGVSPALIAGAEPVLDRGAMVALTDTSDQGAA